MTTIDLIARFKKIYDGTEDSIEEGLSQLKTYGASQIDSIKVLNEVLGISLREADKIVLHSKAWNLQRDVTLDIRKDFDTQVNNSVESNLTDKSRVFLEHLLLLLKSRIDELPAMSNTSNQFDSGISFAYHEVACYVKECSEIFGIKLDDLGVLDFNPDKML